MDPKKSFERQYSLNVARLKLGSNTDEFEVNDDFFQHFDQDIIQGSNVHVDLGIYKSSTHLDVTFSFDGTVRVACDRCGELYDQPIQEKQRIFYAFDENMKFEGYEVMYVDAAEPWLSIVQELYDFIHLAVPLRRVPDTSIHQCDPAILHKLGLDEEGNPLEKESEEVIDPRWEKLKKLRDQMEK